jgi:hypothetical protein
MKRLRDGLSYANVMATMAVFIALGGGAYAAAVKTNSVTSKSVKNNTLKGKDVKDNKLTGTDVDESTLKLTCPAGTLMAAGTCIETAPRANLPFEAAMNACAAAGRKLPTPSEHRTFAQLPTVTIVGAEHTGVYDTDGGTTHALGQETGLSVSTDASFPRPFRCATGPGVE